jgi:hypothetical protein
MIHVKTNRSVQLPGEPVPTTAENVQYQSKDAIASNTHPYWKAFSGGFIEGFTFPFAALFGMAGCSNNFSLPPTNDGAPCDASADSAMGEISKTDASADGQVRPLDVQPEDAELDVAVDVEDGASDVAQDLSEDATVADGQELPLDAVSTDDGLDAEEVLQDTTAELPEDATLTDSAEDVADAADLPQNATADVAETPDVYDSGICQYFCDTGATGTTDASDAVLPQDATPSADIPPPPSGLTSKLCTGPAGTETLSAPSNSVAVACTNGTINSLIQGGTSCVAECGYFDSTEILFSQNPLSVNKFSETFIDFAFKLPKPKITMTIHAPLLSKGKTPLLPQFMGVSHVYVFNQEEYDKSGMFTWETQGENGKFKNSDYFQLVYQPKDEFFGTTPEFFEFTYITTTGGKISYRYPCNALKNPIIQCAEEVK